MKITFTDAAWEDYQSWVNTDRRTLKRINRLIEDIKRGDEGGIGKPEILKNNLAGYMSRRITSEHRLVYAVEDDTVVIIACRYHYE